MATKSATTTTKKSGAAKRPVTATVKTETLKEDHAKIAETEKAPETTKAKPVKPAAKPAAKKAAAKKTTAAKKEMNVEYTLEYQSRQVKEKEIIANVKKAWTRSGKRIGDIRTLELYVKPEEYMVYFVVNGSDTGSVSL